MSRARDDRGSTVVFFVVFLVVPIFQNVLYMFESGSLTSSFKFIGLRNFENIAQ